MAKSIDIVIPLYKIAQSSAIIDNLNDQLCYFESCPMVKTVVLVSDYPADNEVLKKMIVHFTKIYFIQNCRNFGQGYSRNKGYKYTTSQYIVFLDQDDKINFGEINWNCDLVFTKTEICNDSGSNRYFAYVIPFLLSKTNEINKLLPLMLANIRVSPGSFAIKRELFDLVDGFPDLNNKGSDDYGFLIRAMVACATVQYCRNTKFTYITHSEQSRNVLDLNKSIIEFYHLDYPVLPFIYKCLIRLRITWFGSILGQFLARIISV